jgi:hypothetical protein
MYPAAWDARADDSSWHGSPDQALRRAARSRPAVASFVAGQSVHTVAGISWHYFGTMEQKS